MGSCRVPHVSAGSGRCGPVAPPDFGGSRSCARCRTSACCTITWLHSSSPPIGELDVDASPEPPVRALDKLHTKRVRRSFDRCGQSTKGSNDGFPVRLRLVEVPLDRLRRVLRQLRSLHDRHIEEVLEVERHVGGGCGGATASDAHRCERGTQSVFHRIYPSDLSVSSCSGVSGGASEGVK